MLTEAERRTIAGYDSTAGTYDRENPPFFVDPIIRAWGDRFPADPVVLDVGCGTGRFIPITRQLGVDRYLGIDPSAGMLGQARQRYPDHSFICADVCDLPLHVALGSFDAFVATCSLMHIERPRMPDALRAIRFAVCIGAPGLISLPCGRENFQRCVGNEDEVVTTFCWEPADFYELCRAVGFAIISEEFAGGMMDLVLSVV